MKVSANLPVYQKLQGFKEPSEHRTANSKHNHTDIQRFVIPEKAEQSVTEADGGANCQNN